MAKSTKANSSASATTASTTKQSTPSSQTETLSTQQESNSSNQQQDAVSLLKEDHRKVTELFEKYQNSESEAEKKQLALQVCTELIVHTRLEEELFYAACREHQVESDLLDEAQVEHDGAKLMIRELLTNSVDSEFYDAKVTVLSEYIKHHVGEEEKPSDGIFAKAQAAGVDMSALGRQLQARKQELMSRIQISGISPPMPRSLNFSQTSNPKSEDQTMASANYRERDENGRFSSDQRSGYRSSGRSSGRDEDYGRYGRDDDERSYRGNERDRDEYGRFVSDDDERGGGRGYRSNERDRDESGRFTSDDRSRYSERDDDNRSSRGGRGGWFGDSEGHSQAASQRGSGRSRYDEDEDRSRSGSGRGWFGDSEGHSRAASERWEESGSGRSSRGRDDDYDDDRSSRSSRGHGGWFGDPEGHSRAASERWEGSGSSRSSRGRDDDDDRSRSSGSGRGWFGDSEGHSQAASQRGSGRSSRGRDQDDDDRSSNGDHRGWFGDPRGHAQAARRGWQNR